MLYDFAFLVRLGQLLSALHAWSNLLSLLGVAVL